MVSKEDISIIKNIAISAGNKICEIKYKSEKKVRYKKDATPVTIADIESNKIILDNLKKNFPAIPIISEESNNIIHLNENYYFLVDPLDGTKEFIKGSEEYTVNIALMKKNKPILGIIYIPEKKEIFWNDNNNSYYEKNKIKKRIKVSNDCEKILKVELSRSHLDDYTRQFLKLLDVEEFNYSGSSLKLCNLALGHSNLYPRFGATMEWDIAAGHAILKNAGGEIFTTKLEILCYNKPNLINKSFIAVGSLKIPSKIKILISEINNEKF